MDQREKRSIRVVITRMMEEEGREREREREDGPKELSKG
jgi:hypothetical protein